MSSAAETVRLFLCGDVMTGRGIDQALPHPVDPALHEPYIRDARNYVDLAESAHGPIPRPVELSYIWGEALQELERAAVDLRIVNLETAMAPAILNVPGKGRALLFSFGSTSSGIPRDRRATDVSPGVNLLDDLSEATASQIASQMRDHQKPDDLLIASIHWGDNWGY